MSLFSAEIGNDETHRILTEISATAKQSYIEMFDIFVDFTVNPRIARVDKEGNFYELVEVDGSYTLRKWGSIDELTQVMSEYRVIQLPNRRNPDRPISLGGLKSYSLDPCTSVFFIRSNAMNAEQRSNPNSVFKQYIAYMETYRLKRLYQAELAREKNGKVNSGYTSNEYLNLTSGYIPFMILNNSENSEFLSKLKHMVEATPLKVGFKEEPILFYNPTTGKLIKKDETFGQVLWISKLALFNFITWVKPGAELEYRTLSTPIGLQILFEYFGVLDVESFKNEYQQHHYEFPPTVHVEFTKDSMDHLGIQRVFPIPQ